MKKRSKHRDIQIFKEIAEILNIEFSQAEELFFKINKTAIEEQYDLMNIEEKDDV